MPRPRRPPALHGCVFRARDVLRDGLLTPDALRSSAWRRLFRGVYADARLPESFGLRVRAARLLAPQSGVFSGRTAAYLHGATELVDLRSPVEVSIPDGVRFGPVHGMRVRRVALPPTDVARLGEWRCTTAVRTALDFGRWEPLPEAVAALDVMLRRSIVATGEVRDEARLRTGRGFRQAQKAVALADPRAESQPESRLRVLLALAGLFPDVQYPVRDGDGVVVARVDLAFVEQRVAIEYDGAWHSAPGQFAKDRRRLNRLVAAGWTVFHVTAVDMRDPAGLVARLRAVLVAPSARK